jgi:hypothetical protein
MWQQHYYAERAFKARSVIVNLPTPFQRGITVRRLMDENTKVYETVSAYIPAFNDDVKPPTL